MILSGHLAMRGIMAYQTMLLVKHLKGFSEYWHPAGDCVSPHPDSSGEWGL